MPRFTLRVSLVATLIALLAGCASTSGEGGEKAVSVPTGEGSVDPKREAVLAENVANKPALDPTERREERASASAENARLHDQLNEMSRELASVRAANARLRARSEGSDSAAASASSSAKADPIDDKLAASLKSYGALKSELAGLVAEIERLRADNSRAKEAAGRIEDVRAAVSRLEGELRTEKRARADAEQAVAKLQEQLRTIARALNAAGLSVEKLAGSESGRER